MSSILRDHRFGKRIIQSLLFWILTICVWPVLALAQSYPEDERCIPAWNSFAGSDALPSTIFYTQRASDGFIYLGGRDGLYRLEGASVESWTPDFTDPAALPAGRVTTLASNANYVWAGTAAGLVRLDTTTDQITRISLPETNGRQPAITALHYNQGQLLVGTNEHVFSLDVTPTGLSAHKIQDSVDTVNAILTYEETVLVGSEEGLFALNAQNRLVPIEINGSHLPIVDLATGPEQTLWALTENALFQSSAPMSGEWATYREDTVPGLPHEGMMAMAFDQMGRLWLSGPTGLARWQPDQAYAHPCRRSLLGSQRDEDIFISHLNGDLGAFMLVGSHGRGAAYAPIGTGVRRIVTGTDFNPGLPPSPVWSTELASDGRLYLGTTQGIYRETTARSGHFTPVGQAILANERVFELAEMRSGDLWAGTDTGAFRLNSEQISELPGPQAKRTGLRPARVFAFAETDDHKFIASSAGLVVLDARTDTPTRFFRTNADYTLPEPSHTLDVDAQMFWSVQALEDGTVLVCGPDSVFWLDPTNARVLASSIPASNAGEFVTGRIYAAVRTADDEVLLGTEAGLIWTDLNFQTFERQDAINDLPLASVMSAGLAQDGSLWIGVAGNGLFRRAPETHEWSHITQANGLITNGVSQLGLTISDTGHIVASNATGVSVLPASFQPWSSVSTQNLVARELNRGTPLPSGSTTVIGPADRDLRLHFAVSDLLETNMHRVEYHFHSEGVDSESAHVQLGEDLIFPNLAPGRYRFEGRLTSTKGIGSTPLAFSIVVQPFWWERSELPWVLLLLVMMLAGGLYGLRLRAVQYRFKLVSDERKRIAQDIHDTFLQDVFGARMVLNTISGAQQETEVRAKREQVSKLLKNATAAVRTSVNEMSHLDAAPSLVESVKHLKETCRFEDWLETDVQESGTCWPMSDERLFFLSRIIQEALVNTYKHSGQRKAKVQVHWSWTRIHILISDKGNGFDPNSEAAASGFGLGSMKRLALAASAKLDVISSPGEGVEVHIKGARFTL